MDRVPEPLTPYEQEQLAEDFTKAAEKGDYEQLVKVARHAEASPEEVMDALRKAIELLDSALRTNLNMDDHVVERYIITTLGSTISGLGAGAFTGHLIAHLAGISDPVFDAVDYRGVGAAVGTAVGGGAGVAIATSQRLKRIEAIRARLDMLGRAMHWWFENMPPESRARA